MKKGKNSQFMLVSVIITTKNEEKNIQKCLESIEKQSFPRENTEVIVVDNNSTDKTKEIALDYSKKVFNFGPERSAQRNFGISHSEGKYVLYLDADMELTPNVIRESVEKMENNKKIIALYIPEIIKGDIFWNRVRNFERGFYNGTSIDAVRFIRKEFFEKTGGFDENLTGPEDWDLDKKIRALGLTEIINSPIYHHEENFKLKDYLKKKSYYSQDFEKYIAKWGKYDSDIRKQFGLWYRYVEVFTENGNWKKLLLHPVLASGMYFLRFLVGINFLLKK